jgi:hypothetical protein
MIMNYKEDCIKYVESLGYKVQYGNVYLNNYPTGPYQIVKFTGDWCITVYNNLYKDKDLGICSGYNDIIVKNFEDFKKVFDGIVDDYKKLKMEIKMDKMKEDFA